MDRWKEGGTERETFKEVEKGQAQITLAVTRASGSLEKEKKRERMRKEGGIIFLMIGNRNVSSQKCQQQRHILYLWIFFVFMS